MSASERPAVARTACRPATVCSALLAALDAAEGRRRSRKRNQTPDAIGLGAKRSLLERVVQDDPEADAFEDWLLQYAASHGEEARSSALAMARAVLDEWRLAHAMPQFALWLADGAPSDDVQAGSGGGGTPSVGPSEAAGAAGRR